MAFIRAKTQNINGKTVTNGSHYNLDQAPASVKICFGAKVMLTGWNACPEWGLFHGAIGTVEDIVFDEGNSPNHYKLLLSVLCNFQQFPHNQNFFLFQPFKSNATRLVANVKENICP